jgi:hypothetical protein
MWTQESVVIEIDYSAFKAVKPRSEGSLTLAGHTILHGCESKRSLDSPSPHIEFPCIACLIKLIDSIHIVVGAVLLCERHFMPGHVKSAVRSPCGRLDFDIFFCAIRRVGQNIVACPITFYAGDMLDLVREIRTMLPAGVIFKS